MPNKRGRLGADEIEFVILNMLKMTPAEIATRLRRQESTISAYIKSRGVKSPENREEVRRAESLCVRADLRNTEKWKRLKDELTDQEIRFFDEEYVKLMGQFGGDVLPSEETQVFDCIKFEILKSRNMAERKRARQDISRLEDELDQLGHPDDYDEKRRSKALVLETQLNISRAAEQSRTSEYVKLQERHDALMKSMKSTRDQRIRDISTGTETVLGLLKKLKQAEFRQAEGREMELMKMAAGREYERLGRPHEYEDGNTDRPILSSETVGLGEEEAHEP
jgi:hypothetical protein